jgi:ribosomal protein S18 acetylase RimI-like enzyme
MTTSAGQPENIPIKMLRQTLDGIPDHPFPAGFSLRGYQPGDEVFWTQIHLQSDLLNEITPALFVQQFGTDTSLLAQRQCYVINQRGAPVGTGTAWFNKNLDDIGRVHWVAIVPRYQRRGLASALMTVVCRRIRELGHAQAYLTTSTARLHAIKLYQRFGFAPWIRSETERTAWQAILANLGRGPKTSG